MYDNTPYRTILYNTLALCTKNTPHRSIMTQLEGTHYITKGIKRYITCIYEPYTKQRNISNGIVTYLPKTASYIE